VSDYSRLADNIAAHLTPDLAIRQAILQEMDIEKRFQLLFDTIQVQLDLLRVDQKIQGRVRDQVEKNQRQFYLSEKIKAIQTELGEMDDKGSYDELKQIEIDIENAGMSAEAKEKALAEMKKLKAMSPMSAEATVSRNYLDWLIKTPWKAKSQGNHDLQKAMDILNADHFGLEKIKERVIEFLAVQSRVKKMKGPILCLVGPPGVGKTSLGRSIAKVAGREFARISLGGMRDEAEIRGHRRTYIGALPGRIIQRLVKAKVKDPLFMLDEIDKMARDFRGDPASALLEVLDPEQNNTFNDHYLEVDYDLSDVMFLATANSLDIPDALRDRMEVIELSGYTETEKMHIAKDYLVTRQVEANGLQPHEMRLHDKAILDVIRYYTREAGVRNLERAIAKICRKVLKERLLDKAKKTTVITPKNLDDYLGVKKYRFGLAEKKNSVGYVTGLAWTQVGGDILMIEAQTLEGKGKSQYTGSLGEVMQESISAAMTVVRTRSTQWGLSPDFFQFYDFHIHVPEGATPKDGPSAGIGMCTALVSAITHIPVRSDVAMTGEITLRGEVLPIGGLKSKLLAALRGGIKKVLIPKDNQRDLKDVPAEVMDGLTIVPVQWIDEVLEHALVKIPTARDMDAINKKVQIFSDKARFIPASHQEKKQADSAH
jgi:ATP-dependent Lon protease